MAHLQGVLDNVADPALDNVAHERRAGVGHLHLPTLPDRKCRGKSAARQQ